MTKKLHVISHTHWDFEWYFSAHESLIQLIYHLDEVMEALESGDVNNYYLDGQLSIVEDYLQACPEQRQRFCKLVEQGLLIIGPWYTQTDQLIIAGESIIRNLQLGIRIGESLGGCEMLGYVPDSFGQSIDMPKIYNGFGINKTVFWRGLASDIYPFREGHWGCEDGSSVQFYNIKDGYYVGGQLIYADDSKSLVKQVETGCLSNDIALPLGGDQRFVDRNVKSRIAMFNQQLAEDNIPCQLIESSYKDLFSCIEKQDLPNKQLMGEMIDGQVSKIHRSIYSSRADHKRLNDKLERRLTLELEPLMTLATCYGLNYKAELLNNIWRLLLRNHAHDSAGGCNTDKTNKIILERYEQVDQMSASARDYLIRKLAESQSILTDGRRLTLFNTLPFIRHQVQQIFLATKSTNFVLHDLSGAIVEFELLEQKKQNNGSIQRDINDNDPNCDYYLSTIVLRYPLPALGFTSLILNEIEPSFELELLVDIDKASIENHRYQVDFINGELQLTDKRRGDIWLNFLSLIDGGDDGDTYDYSPPSNDWLLSLNFEHACIKRIGGVLSQTLILTGSWLLPRNLKSREQRICDVVCPYKLELTLNNDDMPLQISISIDNQADDHRIQLLIDSPLDTISSTADTPFGFTTRPHYQKQLKDWREQGWKEEPSGIYPMINYVNLHTDNISLTLFSQGIKEYEVLDALDEQSSGKMALTLFRCVGWLGKPDLLRRPGIASGQQYKYIATPDSQMHGQQTAVIGLRIDDSFIPSDLSRVWQSWSVNLPYYQEQSLNQFTNTLKYFVIHPLTQTVPEKDSLLMLACPDLICSSLLDECGEIVIRFYNPSLEPVYNSGSVDFSREIVAASEVDLNNYKTSTIQTDNKALILGDFKPKQIRSFKIKLC